METSTDLTETSTMRHGEINTHTIMIKRLSSWTNWENGQHVVINSNIDGFIDFKNLH